MKLFKISQSENNGWDTYDSAIVAAETEEDARKTHPSASQPYPRGEYWDSYVWVSPKDISKVKVEYIGEAKEGTDEGAICSSFNAG